MLFHFDLVVFKEDKTKSCVASSDLNETSGKLLNSLYFSISFVCVHMYLLKTLVESFLRVLCFS